MWLINVLTRKLEYFEGSNIPPYAILSHRWQEEEVSFQEYQDGTGVHKKGYSKIDAFCRIVADRSHQIIQQSIAEVGWRKITFEHPTHAWVDTCCIDKRSSAELSEAINSMFHWYQNAVVCYAYLCDVGISNGRDCIPDFMASVWFTRGWTLQELLAPSVLVFFDRAWTIFGTKISLFLTISEVTGINKKWLRPSDSVYDAFGRRPYYYKSGSFFPQVHEVFAWASKRITTRIEDQAYCLLGLFDINMPLLYGEGHKAFERLQQELLRKTGARTSILAWTRAADNDYTSGLFAHSPSAFSPKYQSWKAYTDFGPDPSITADGLSGNFLLWPLSRVNFWIPLLISDTEKKCLAMLVSVGTGANYRVRGSGGRSVWEVPATKYTQVTWRAYRENFLLDRGLRSRDYEEDIGDFRWVFAEQCLPLQISVHAGFRLKSCLKFGTSDSASRHLKFIATIDLKFEESLTMIAGYTSAFQAFCLLIRGSTDQPQSSCLNIPRLEKRVALGDEDAVMELVSDLQGRERPGDRYRMPGRLCNAEWSLVAGDELELFVADKAVHDVLPRRSPQWFRSSTGLAVKFCKKVNSEHEFISIYIGRWNDCQGSIVPGRTVPGWVPVNSATSAEYGFLQS